MHNISLELFQHVKSLSELAALLKITSVEQLLKLTPEDLFQLYACGRMSVVCMLDEPINRDMWFRRNNNEVWGRVDDNEMHKVEIRYDKAEDYIDYTLRYFNVEGMNKMNSL